MSGSQNSGFNFFSQSQGAVPVEATYGRSHHSDEHILSKDLIKVFPENTQNVQGGGVIRFHIAANGKMLDPKSMMLFFTMKATQANNYLCGSLHTLIQTLTVKVNNSDLIERIDNYNLIRNQFSKYLQNYTHTQKNEIGKMNGAAYDRYGGKDVVFPSASSQYGLRFDLSGFLSQNRYIPMDAIRSLDIEIQLASATDVFIPAPAQTYPTTELQTYYASLEVKKTAYDAKLQAVTDAGDSATEIQTTALTTATNEYVAALQSFRAASLNEVSLTQRDAGEQSSYTLSNVYLCADVYDFSIPYRAALNEALQTNGLFFETESYLDYNPTISSDNAEIIIRRDFSSLKSIYIALSNNYTKRDQVVTNLLESYQVFVDNKPCSGHKILCSERERAESEHEIHKAFRIHGDLQHQLGNSQKEVSYTSAADANGVMVSDGVISKMRSADRDSYRLIAVDLEKSSLLSGRSCQEIRINLKFKSNTGAGVDAITTAKTAHVFLHYDLKILALPGFQFSQIS